jgi:hypothetical protein
MLAAVYIPPPSKYNFWGCIDSGSHKNNLPVGLNVEKIVFVY